MGKSLSLDLRERVVDEVAGGASRRGAARRFGVSAATGVRYQKRLEETGSLVPSKQGRPAGGGKLAPYRDELIAWLEADGDISMPELAMKLEVAHGVVVHPSSLSRLCLCAGYTFKKNGSGRRGRTR